MPQLNILSLNLHCLVEENLSEKQQRIATTIIHEKVDVVLLQEVAQSKNEELLYADIKTDNYAYVLQQLLQEQGHKYYLVYYPFKSSFDQYDEGLAILSKVPLEIVSKKQLSTISSYHNWKRRCVLVCQILLDKTPLVFGNTHFGWSDETETFTDQFDRAFHELPQDRIAFLGGDFNIKPTSNEYQHIIKSGLVDLFDVDAFRNEPTHVSNIDVHEEGARIDYIMSNQDLQVTNRKILFTESLVSDHYGIFVTVNLK